MPPRTERTFSRGEIAPALRVRADLQQYTSALARLRNFYVGKLGGAVSRPGTKWVGQPRDVTAAPALIPFVFNADQAYVLEFGHEYMRVIRREDGVSGYVIDTAIGTAGVVAISAITAADPGVVTTGAAHGLTAGDAVVISGVEGMVELNGHPAYLVGATGGGGTTFELADPITGLDFSTATYSAYTGGGTVTRVYQITTPYTITDVPYLQFKQNADEMVIVHRGYAPRLLTRADHDDWTLAAIDFGPVIGRPADLAFIAGHTGGATTHVYQVTAVSDANGEEGLPGYAPAQNLGAAPAITQANPAVVTYAGGDNYLNGDQVFITGVVGMTQVNDRIFTIDNVNTGANTFELVGEDSTGYGAHTSGGTIRKTWLRTDAGPVATSTSAGISFEWTAVAGAREYNVYKRSAGVFAFIGSTVTNSFVDFGQERSFTDSPPEDFEPFDGAGNWPGAITSHNGRDVYASTTNNSELVRCSRVGAPYNFLRRQLSLLQDDDAFNTSLVGRNVNEIRHLIALRRLLALSSGGEWSINGNESGTLTPFAINAREESYEGASVVRPLIVGNHVLYVVSRTEEFGNLVRSLGFDFESDGYGGAELSMWSSHLLEGRTIVSWAYQKRPESIVWMVTDDGKLLSMTYVPDQSVVGWAEHDTQGEVKRVCAIPEGVEDGVYLVVKRTVEAVFVQYVERLSSRLIDPNRIEDFVGMDCALTYDGRPVSAGNVVISSASAIPVWTAGSGLILGSPIGDFVAGDEGDTFLIYGPNGVVVTFTVDSFIGSTTVQGTADIDIPFNMQEQELEWERATVTTATVIRGLWPLEGKSVSVFADGYVIGSPNNPAYAAFTVTNGAITLPEAAGVVHVGLPYICDLQPLDIDSPGDSLDDHQKLTTAVVLQVEKSRGIFTGPKEPPSATPLLNMTEAKIRESENYDEPVDLLTGRVKIDVEAQWNSNGAAFIRQVDPVPLTVLAITRITVAKR